MTRVGVISDTHGLLRPEVLEFLRGSDLIVHAGDICEQSVLDALGKLAKVSVVKGNNDRGEWTNSLNETELFSVANHWFYVIHDLSQIDIDPIAAGVHVVISGHSHKPMVQEKNGVLFLNPGSAGPRRFSLPISVAELIIDGQSINANIKEFASF
jgi:uncharacterized protein